MENNLIYVNLKPLMEKTEIVVSNPFGEILTRQYAGEDNILDIISHFENAYNVQEIFLVGPRSYTSFFQQRLETFFNNSETKISLIER